MIEAILRYQFLQHAVLASLLASVLCGLVGVITVEKKLVMMSGGIAHTAYGGVGLGYLAGFEPMLGAILFSLLSSFGIGYMRRRGGTNSDVIIALFWSLGMASGIAFVGLASGYPPDINSYLFGSILAVTRTDLTLMAGLALAVVLILVAFFNDWKSFLFDSGFASITGMRTRFLEYLLLAVIAMTVVVLIRVSGIMLAIALLTAPASCAALLSNRLGGRMLLACGFSAAFCLLGLALSYFLEIPSGATIIGVAVLTYAALYFGKMAHSHKQDRKFSEVTKTEE